MPVFMNTTASTVMDKSRDAPLSTVRETFLIFWLATVQRRVLKSLMSTAEIHISKTEYRLNSAIAKLKTVPNYNIRIRFFERV